MAHYKLTLVAMMAVLCSVCIQTGSAITCYSCSSDGRDFNKCGSSPQRTITTTTFSNGTIASCASCTTTVDGLDSYSRDCVADAQTGCTSTSSGSTTCYCTGDICNSKPVQYGRGTLQCYSCQSIDFMDNGCGATLDSNSVYVEQISGCFACSKSVQTSPGGGKYYRGCLYNVSSSNACASTPSAKCDFRCESNLCNIATTTTATTCHSIILYVVSAIYAVSLCRI